MTRKLEGPGATVPTETEPDLDKILHWQLEKIEGHCRLLQEHATDPTCSCEVDLTSCLRKHCLVLESYAVETLAMAGGDERLAGLLEDLSIEARAMKEKVASSVCGQGNDDLELSEIASFGRRWAKLVETGYTCPISAEAAEIPAELPEFTGKAYRVDSDFWHEEGTTAGDVVRYEQEELGNSIGVTKQIEKYLDNFRGKDVVWVTKTKKDAVYYLGEDEEEDESAISEVILPKGSKIVGKDAQGGYLVLKGDARPLSAAAEHPWAPCRDSIVEAEHVAGECINLAMKRTQKTGKEHGCILTEPAVAMAGHKSTIHLGHRGDPAFHTHPSGTDHPSSDDFSEAHEYKRPYFCIGYWKHDEPYIGCYRNTEALAGEGTPVKVAGKCTKGSCTFKVTAVDKTTVETTSVKALPKAIDEVIATIEGRGPAPGRGSGSSETHAIGQTKLTRYEFKYRIMPADSLIVSHDPFTFMINKSYPAELQPRLRERAATQLQVQHMAMNLDPAALLTEYHSLDRGAPIVGPDKVVESGNGRIMAIIRAAKDHPEVYAGYVKALKDKAPDYGLSPDQVDKVKTPVLVRERISDIDRKTFTEEANASTTIELSAIEKARTDAKKINIESLLGFETSEGESIEDAVRANRNQPFVVTFLGKLPDYEQAKLVDAKGMLNQDGVRRIVMAMFVSAFPGDSGLQLSQQFFESTDINVRNVFNGIAGSLGLLAQVEMLTRKGDRYVDYNISDDLAKTVTVFSTIKKTPGMTVDKYLAQMEMLERQLNPFQERILKVLDENSRSGKRIAAILSGYAQKVISSAPPQQVSLMPEVGRATKEELFEAALESSVVAAADPGGYEWLAGRLEKCNLSKGEANTALDWSPLRRFVAYGLDIGKPVSLCSVGMVPGVYQVTMRDLDTQEMAAAGNLANTVPGMKRVYTPYRELVYEVVIPEEEKTELGWKPQAIIEKPRGETGRQAVFAMSREPGIGTAIMTGLGVGTGLVVSQKLLKGKEAEMDKTKVTELELRILKASRKSEFGDAGVEGEEPWTFSVIEISGIPEKQARGVLASLVKKGLIKMGDSEGEGRYSDSYMWLTPEGIIVEATGHEGGEGMIKDYTKLRDWEVEENIKKGYAEAIAEGRRRGWNILVPGQYSTLTGETVTIPGIMIMRGPSSGKEISKKNISFYPTKTLIRWWRQGDITESELRELVKEEALPKELRAFDPHYAHNPITLSTCEMDHGLGYKLDSCIGQVEERNVEKGCPLMGLGTSKCPNPVAVCRASISQPVCAEAHSPPDHKPLPAPFGWVGGKSRLSKQIVSLIPEHRVYVESFAGAASVFWQKPPSEVEILNDIDPDLMRFYRELHNLEGCDLPKDSKKWNLLLNQNGQLQPCQLITETVCSFGSMRKSKAISGGALKQCLSNAPKFHQNLPSYRKRIKGVILLNGDWQDVVEHYDSPDAFFYFDPPYHATSRSYHFGDDHLARLAEVLPLLKGKWILSYDDHLDVRQAFKDFNIKKTGSHYSIAGGEGPIGKQLIIANFPLQSAS